MKQYERVRATTDLPGGIERRGVKAGATGFVIEAYRTGRFEVEFLTPEGRTIDVITCAPEQIEPAPHGGATALASPPQVSPSPAPPAPINVNVTAILPEQKPPQVHLSQPITVQPAPAPEVKAEIHLDAPPAAPPVTVNVEAHLPAPAAGAKKVTISRDAQGNIRSAEVTPTDPAGAA